MDQLRAIAIQKDLDQVLAAFAAKHGLTVAPTRGSFTNTDIKISVVFGDVATIGSPDVNPELVRNLKRNGDLYGLTMSHLNKKVNIGTRHNLTFQGLRGKKAVFKDPSGQSWLYDAALASDYLRRS